MQNSADGSVYDYYFSSSEAPHMSAIGRASHSGDVYKC